MNSPPARGRPLELIVVCPHFRPDTAPTGVVMSRIVDELVALGHRVHVITTLPWYRGHAVEPGWTGRRVRTEPTPWGSITRTDPFAGGDKRDLIRRALGFLASSTLMAAVGMRCGGWFRRVDAVVAMSPPLTLGVTGLVIGRLRRARVAFNVQDVFPDAAIRTGTISDGRVIAVASWLERVVYRRVDAVTVLSDDLAANVREKLPGSDAGKVHVIPNFVDTDAVRPADRDTPYRRELGIDDEPVVMYAGNVGLSQSFDLVLAAARALPEVVFVVNGDGAARASLESDAADLENVVFRGFVEPERLPELLASGDVHVVPLKPGLARVSLPSKTYSILAAARPVVAAIDEATAVPAILAESGGGLTVPPDDPEAFVDALRSLVADPGRRAEMGRGGRAWAETNASPAAVAGSYDQLLRELADPRGGESGAEPE